jgi:hypothetical protein
MVTVDRKDSTYKSTFAWSSSSRVFSQVGCHIGISKYLTRKGNTALSRTRNKKNLPPTEMRTMNTMGINNECKLLTLGQESTLVPDICGSLLERKDLQAGHTVDVAEGCHQYDAD